MYIISHHNNGILFHGSALFTLVMCLRQFYDSFLSEFLLFIAALKKKCFLFRAQSCALHSGMSRYITWLSSWCLQDTLGWWPFDSLFPDFLQNHILFLCQCLCLHLNNRFSPYFPIFFLVWFFSSAFPFLTVFPLKLVSYCVAPKVTHFSSNVFFFFYFLYALEAFFLLSYQLSWLPLFLLFVFLWSWCHGVHILSFSVSF